MFLVDLFLTQSFQKIKNLAFRIRNAWRRAIAQRMDRE